MTISDTGCELHPSCLECPRPICKYDDPDYKKRDAVTLIERNERILELRKQGLPVGEIVRAFGISHRTYARAMKAAGR